MCVNSGNNFGEPPVVTSVTPSPIQQNLLTWITVEGSGFIEDSVVMAGELWISASWLTQFVSDTELRAQVMIDDPTSSQTELEVYVVNGRRLGTGPKSNSVIVPVTVPTNLPTVTAVTPGEWAADAVPVELTITGTNFTPDTIVYISSWLPIPTVFVSSTELTVTYDREGGVDNYSLAVVNPDGGHSGYVTVFINMNLHTVAPNSVPIGTTPTTITLTGTFYEFDTPHYVIVSSSPDVQIPTTWLSDTQVTFEYTPSVAGTFQVKASTVDSANRWSNELPLTVTP